eukprot:10317178-Alexandrium_andersonii.AAC.1
MMFLEHVWVGAPAGSPGHLARAIYFAPSPPWEVAARPNGPGGPLRGSDSADIDAPRFSANAYWIAADV